MVCDKCGYVLDDFTTDCPRCIRINQKNNYNIYPEEQGVRDSLLQNKTGIFNNLDVKKKIIFFAILIAFLVCIPVSYIIYSQQKMTINETTPIEQNAPVMNNLPPSPDTVTNNNLNNSTKLNNSQPTNYNYNIPIKKEPKQIYSNAAPSIVSVAGGSDYSTSFGSGFFISNNIIATNEHVIRNKNVFVSRIVGRKDFLQFTNFRNSSKSIDIAFLTVPTNSAIPLLLGDDSLISVGDDVFVIGNPEGFEGTFSTGMVSAIRKNDDGTIDDIQITAPISSGSSGGPVLDSNGKVIGIAYCTWSDGQNINFAIPVSKLKKYMSECGISPY